MFQTNQITTTIVMVFIAVVVGCRDSQDNSTLHNFPSAVSELFYEADSVELLSLIPDDQSPSEMKKFHGYPILGSVTLTDKQHLGKMAQELDRAVETNDSFGVRCFWPRHGLRGTVDGKSVELLICFQCHKLNVYVKGEYTQTIEMDSRVKPIFDAPLVDAGIEIDASPKR